MAAIFSPGDSIATVGVPNVTPSKEARAPPSEWPVIQMLASGYRYVRLLYRFLCARKEYYVRISPRYICAAERRNSQFQ